MKDVRSLQSAFGYERDVTKAEQLIGQILELLADAEGVGRGSIAQIWDPHKAG